MSLPALLSVTGDFPAQSSAPLIFNLDSCSFTSDSSFDVFTPEPMLTSLASKLDSLKSELVQVVVLSSKVVAKVLERKFLGNSTDRNASHIRNLSQMLQSLSKQPLWKSDSFTSLMVSPDSVSESLPRVEEDEREDENSWVNPDPSAEE